MGVDVQVSSRYLDRATRLIRQGLPSRIFRPGLEGEPDKPHTGRSTSSTTLIDPTTSTFLVRAEVANPDGHPAAGRIRQGRRSPSASSRTAIVVPEEAVVETQAGPTVYTVDKEGKVAVARVKAAITYDGLRVIESGLEPGQQVIVEGIQLVRPGMRPGRGRPVGRRPRPRPRDVTSDTETQ